MLVDKMIPLILGAAATVGAHAADYASPKSFGVGRSQIVISSSQETELLNYEMSGTYAYPAASINFFWITGDPWSNGPSTPTGQAAGVDYSIWRFYIDGESVPSVKLQMSQAAFVGNADSSAPWDNDFFGKNSKFGGWHVNIPIQFQHSVRVTIKLPEWWNGTERVFAMCRGVEGLPNRIGSFELPPTARLVASVSNSSELAPLGFHELVNVPLGTSGLMLGTMIDITMYGAGAESLNTLEGCWHAYSPPDTPFPGSFVLGTGAEDYPESAFYFNAGPYRGPTSGLTVMKPGANLSLVSFYKLHHKDPFFFNNGFKFQWRNGDITDPETGEKCTVVTGTPIGTPSFVNVTTLSYLYTW
eukprot:m.107915 g.107915  ORF g.107915 m.107915 type:complete len:358 (-) comp12779_c0_seq2:1181-2254(-)